jgi:hypothetical protein
MGQGVRGERGESTHYILVTEGPPEAAPNVSKLGPSHPVDVGRLCRLPLP